ncbi:MAG: PCRF domain-containing protein [Gemmatimonadales bacterium]|nr:PCRF domain-containing protein [Gemmatimonadales bacterium]
MDPPNTRQDSRYPTTKVGAQRVVECLRNGDRTQVRMAAGSGKTTVAIDAAVHLLSGTGGSVVMTVPSLGLLSQSIEEWNAKVGPGVELEFAVLAHGVRIPPQFRMEGGDRRWVPVEVFDDTNEPRADQIMKWWDRPAVAGKIRIVLSTYASTMNLKEATRHRPADLLVVDEAHHAAGSGRIDTRGAKKEHHRVRYLLDDKRSLRANRRLFLTATPRLPSKSGDAHMDGPEFGPVAFSLTYGEALSLGIVKQYNLIIDLLAADSRFQGAEKAGALLGRDVRVSAAHEGRRLSLMFTRTPDGSLPDAIGEDEVAGSIASRAEVTARLMVRGMALTKSRMGISFHRRVRDVKAHHEALVRVSPEMLAACPEYVEDLGLDVGGGIRAYSFTGEDPQKQRAQWMTEGQAGSQPTAFHTCNGIAEGTNIIGASFIALMSPHYGLEAIIQRVGRGTRAGSRVGDPDTVNIYVPVLARRSPDGSLSNISERQANTLRSVQAALRLMDNGFDDAFESMANSVQDELKSAIAASERQFRLSVGEENDGFEVEESIERVLMTTANALRGLVSERLSAPKNHNPYHEGEKPILEKVLASFIKAKAKDPHFRVKPDSWRSRFASFSKSRQAEFLGLPEDEFLRACAFRGRVLKEGIPPDADSEDLWSALTSFGFTMRSGASEPGDPELLLVEKKIMEDAGTTVLFRTQDVLPERRSPLGTRMAQHRRAILEAKVSAHDWSKEGLLSMATKRRPLQGLSILPLMLADTPSEIIGIALRRIIDRNGGLPPNFSLSKIGGEIEQITKERGFGLLLAAAPWKSEEAILSYSYDWRPNAVNWSSGFWEATPTRRFRPGKTSADTSVSLLRSGVVASRGTWLFVPELSRAVADAMADAGIKSDGLITPSIMDELANYLLEDSPEGHTRLRAFGWVPGPFVHAALSRLEENLPIIRISNALVRLHGFDTSVVDKFHEMRDKGWLLDKRTIQERFPVASTVSPRSAKLKERLLAPGNGASPQHRAAATSRGKARYSGKHFAGDAMPPAVLDFLASPPPLGPSGTSSGLDDSRNALLSIHAGAGGAEAHAWAGMLLRMYTLWAKRVGLRVRTLDVQKGEGSAGVESAFLEISGQNAHALLEAEEGVHLLRRISPFDPQARRHTSFASVFVAPYANDGTGNNGFDEGDIKIDTHSTLGVGGQHVNSVAPGVRLTHIPTGLTFSCQWESSQFRNKLAAIKMLRATLYRRGREASIGNDDTPAAPPGTYTRGDIVRSYVFHPYANVTDARTQVTHPAPEAVLGGFLDPFVRASPKLPNEQKRSHYAPRQSVAADDPQSTGGR